jgi:hypothetical protein
MTEGENTEGQNATPERRRLSIVTVHGTGDTAPGPDGDKWFQRGAAFTEQLKSALAVRGFDAEIHPHLWTGANSAREREQAGDKLADHIKRLYRQGGPVHVIGHSHGGNVANEAADFLRWGRRKVKPGQTDRLGSITTVGTPFFKISTGKAETFAGLAFLFLTLLSALTLAFAAIIMVVGFAMGAFTPQSLESSASETAIGVTAILVLIGIDLAAMIFMMRLAIEGARRILRANKITSKTHSLVHAIYHPNDEAIAFLQKLEATPIEPFPKGAMYRSARNPAIVWGVRIVLVIAALAIWSLLVHTAGVEAPAFFKPEQDSLLGQVSDSMLFTVLFTPLIFCAVYLGYRWIFGGLSEVFVRKPMNKMVGGALQGMAYGKDGDQKLSNISTSSHTHPTTELTLSGAIADRMKAQSATAAAALIEKYRWALFTVGSDTDASLNRMSQDAMTWNSLIHTLYFDQPEMAEIIADRIAAAAQKTA